MENTRKESLDEKRPDLTVAIVCFFFDFKLKKGQQGKG
jgi:hypothetical protein